MTKKIDEFAPERIDMVDGNELVRRAFLMSLGDETPGNEFFTSDGIYDVTLVVNGKQLSFSRFVEKFHLHIEAEIETAARNKVEERIKLSSIVSRMYDLSSHINDELDLIFPDTRADRDND